MVSDPREWTVPAPLRALLWWPPVALVVAMVDPARSVLTVAVVGVGLAVLGVAASTVAAARARRAARGAAPAASAVTPIGSVATAAEPAALASAVRTAA